MAASLQRKDASGRPMPPTFPALGRSEHQKAMVLELQDGMLFQGYSFGAEKGTAGELVFSTAMVGYPESLTDPSYRGQILVMTFPLIGNYGVPSMQTEDGLLAGLPAYFEASNIHVAGLVVASYAGEEYSHFLAHSSLGQWLKKEGIPAIYGVDTRAVTKRIRDEGSMLGKLMIQKDLMEPAPNGQPSASQYSETNGSSWPSGFEAIDWADPNVKNLVDDVSIRQPCLFSPSANTALRHPSGRPLRVLCVDVGLKFSQLRCLLARGVEVQVVPWNYDFPPLAGKEYDGLFLSNGPGDPSLLSITIQNLAQAMAEARTPIFGICLGHQLLARAAGATTSKMKFGNRGLNIPCTNLLSGRCYITSQNHGYAVNAASLPKDWEELFVNANDGSNEGVRHVSRPYYSVQFHPEASPGPKDTEFLFDVFVESIQKCLASTEALNQPIQFPGGDIEDNKRLHPRVNVKKVLVLGSGGLSIGQAGEFDYSGSQVIKALKEEGIYTILINPNIATVQTSKGLADKVYFLPVTAEFVRKVISYEQPDGIYVTFGGQTALQVGIQLKDEFPVYGVRVLGTPIETIIKTEDRELFARAMESIGEKCAESASATTIEEAKKAVKKIGFPVIVRAAYALGGLGSGFAENEAQLLELCNKAFAASPQVLIEKSMKGWKEIEYEVVRDARDNCITVCNMENFDPLGIHTGDSIVVAPSQTLSDEDYQMLRTTALNVVRHLGIVGECNIQYALNPFSKEYCIIEVNARLSRSSALASKATGYPLAFIAGKLGLGIPLNELSNSVTRVTCACFEPSLDYVTVKIPRWDLKKFTRVSTLLSSSMKSVGEVMSIGRSFEEAIQKAIRAIDFHNLGFNETSALISIDAELQTPSDQRLFAIANAMRSGYTVETIWQMTRIDKWFLYKLKTLSDFGAMLTNYDANSASCQLVREAKQLGFSDRQLAKFWSSNELAVRRRRIEAGIMPVVKQIDTVAAEFPAFANYLYLTYDGSEHDIAFSNTGVMVLGSGVYRIGSSVEFDWCSVRAVRTLRAHKVHTIIVNYNPETVSTDYDEADKLYFENITLETVLDINQLEKADGVMICMGGQTPNNIALPLHRLNVNVLGTSPEMIDTAENRYKFSRMLDRISVDQPAWKELTSMAEANEFCAKVGYPVLVRPSYVLSGAAMNTAYSKDDLANYLQQAAEVSREHPVVITKYIENAKEIEMDAVAKNGKVIRHFICEHVENAGVHSGDATLVLPPQDLDPETVRRIEVATKKISNALNVTGPFNIQFIAKENEIKVIECNVRASRSFPFVSKVMGVDLIEMATKAIMGLPVADQAPSGRYRGLVAVKVPQFSFSRLSGADPVLGVEMASTGEVACFGHDKYEAYIKALLSTGFRLPNKNVLLSIGSFKDKMELLPSVHKLCKMGYNLSATAGTADFLQEHGISVQYLEILAGENENQKSEYSLTQHLANNLIDLYINLPSNNRFRRPANYMSRGYLTRRMAVDYQTPLVTNVKNAKMLIEALSRHHDFEVTEIDCLPSSGTPQGQSINGANHVNGETYPDSSGLRDIAVRQSRITPLEAPDSGSAHSLLHATMPSCARSAYGMPAANGEPNGEGSPRTSVFADGSGYALYPSMPTLSSSLHELLYRSPFRGQHVLSVNQYTRADLHILFSVAQEMSQIVQRQGGLDILKGRVLCLMFYEPSTRTSASFDVAMQRLGGRTTSITTSHSSVQKGESLADSIRTLGIYGDAIVLRHPDESSAATAAKFSSVPVINGGNGSLEHPTQAFLDLFTIREELGWHPGLTITFMGDLKYGRTVHSLVKLLRYYDVRVQLVAPAELSLPDDVRQQLVASGQLAHESHELTPAIVAQSDVLYCTRVQRERFADLKQYEQLKDSFVVDNRLLKHAKGKMIVMHPLPRNAEISEEVDFDQRAAYFRQMRFGLYCRMALLALVMSPF